MYKLNTTKQFEKDYKLCKKLGLNLQLINSVFELLENKGHLPAKYKPHKLTGNYTGFLECHIQGDGLLIWLLDEAEKEILLIRTGTHSDLF